MDFANRKFIPVPFKLDDVLIRCQDFDIIVLPLINMLEFQILIHEHVSRDLLRPFIDLPIPEAVKPCKAAHAVSHIRSAP